MVSAPSSMSSMALPSLCGLQHYLPWHQPPSVVLPMRLCNFPQVAHTQCPMASAHVVFVFLVPVLSPAVSGDAHVPGSPVALTPVTFTSEFPVALTVASAPPLSRAPLASAPLSPEFHVTSSPRTSEPLPSQSPTCLGHPVHIPRAGSRTTCPKSCTPATPTSVVAPLWPPA